MPYIAFIAVFLSSLYLLALGFSAFLRPDRTAQFLAGFAQSFPAHATELALRIIAGAGLIARAPFMHFERGMTMFGWALVGTSLVLAVIPWRVHQRFANRVIPRITKHLWFIGATSAVGGLFLLGALVLPRAIG